MWTIKIKRFPAAKYHSCYETQKYIQTLLCKCKYTEGKPQLTIHFLFFFFLIHWFNTMATEGTLNTLQEYHWIVKKVSLRSPPFQIFLSALKQVYSFLWQWQPEACFSRERHWDYSSCTAVFFKSQLSSNSEEWVAKLSLLSVVWDLEPGNVLWKYFSSHFLFICPSDLQLYFSKESFLSKKLHLVQTEGMLHWSCNPLFLPSGHC